MTAPVPPPHAVASAAPSRALPGTSLRLVAAACCVLLLTAFAMLSWSAASRMSVTTDEPAHAYAAWLIAQRGDYRADREDPPLWKFVAALPQGSEALTRPLDEGAWRESLRGVAVLPRPQTRALFESPGVDGVAFVTRSRAAMLPVGVAMGALVAAVAWAVGGPTAAIAACALCCLNPNFVGHAPLVKSDVPFTLVFFAAAFATFLAGRRLTPARAFAVATLAGAATVTKFSGLLALPAVGLALVARALLPAPWPFVRATLTRTRDKLLAAASLLVFCLAITYLVIWATYGFRFRPTPDPAIEFNMSGLTGLTAGQQLRHAGVSPTPEALAAWRPDFIIRATLAANNAHTLPQAWLAGFLYTRASSWNRPSFLLGQIRDGGVWYYFPLAVLFKTPQATLAALITSAGVAAYLAARRTWPPSLDRWALAAFGAPFFVYAATALSTNLDIGVRHVFPLFPFLFLFAGAIASEAIRRWRRPAATLVALLLLVSAGETLAAFPDYIAYFNAACGGSRGAARLLGDSNLDWNQDIRLLADWQERHPKEHLFLSFRGVYDPAIYGIRYTPLLPSPDGPPLGVSATPVAQPATLAVRVSQLQGLLVPRGAEHASDLLRRTPPREIVGGSIYLYPYPLPTAPAVRPAQ